MLLQTIHIFHNLPGEHTPGPLRNSCLRPSRCAFHSKLNPAAALPNVCVLRDNRIVKHKLQERSSTKWPYCSYVKALDADKRNVMG